VQKRSSERSCTRSDFARSVLRCSNEKGTTLTTDVFTGKAAHYAKYRWDYAPEAIQAIFDVTGISEQSVVADIGAGTGILTRHFIGQVKQIWAVEPNADMRHIAADTLGGYPSCHIVDGRAEATTLADDSVDLITAAQATGWFEPQPTRAEFLRVLKPGGWFAELVNRGTDDALGKALEPIYPPETDTSTLMKRRGTPLTFYYGHADFYRWTFAFTTRHTWETFIGALSTASYAPHENSAFYADFERAARRVFDCFSTDGVLTASAVTELCLGQMTP
jgi:SAM-dependent methyltransferase